MLTIIASPIGSVEETSLQVTKSLTSSDIILCEDTRTFVPFYKRIQELFKINAHANQKVLSYYKVNEFKELPKVVAYLEENKDVALISEAGTPLLSDPGRLLIETCQKRGIAYTSIPGSSAITNAGVLSGCRFENFLFVGFLPKKSSQLEKQLLVYKNLAKTLKHLEICFFESPNRIQETLNVLSALLPEVTVCVCREMNKKFEEVTIGLPKNLANHTYKGELTIIIIF